MKIVVFLIIIFLTCQKIRIKIHMSKLKIKNILIIEHIKKYFVFYIFSTKGHWKAW